MPLQRVPVGQACANALATYLRRRFEGLDVVVSRRWPARDKDLPARAITVLCVGRRSRAGADAFEIDSDRRVNISDTQAQMTFEIDGVVQPMQLDVWSNNPTDRDDIVAHLDDFLYAGLPETLDVDDDPIRDGILLPLDGEFTGAVADFLFDDPEYPDGAESVQLGEYRAIYSGQAQTAYSVTTTVPRMRRAILQATVSTKPIGAPGVPTDTTTLEKDDEGNLNVTPDSST